MSTEPAPVSEPALPGESDLALLEEAKKTLEAEACQVEVLTELLRNLDTVTVDKHLLQQTKIGITISKFRSHQDPNVAEAAKALVAKWKAAVSSKSAENAGANGEASQASRKRPREDLSPTMGPAEPITLDSCYSGPKAKDDKRNKCREFLFKAFVEGVMEEQRKLLDIQNVSSLIAEIENALWDHHVEQNNNPREYNSQLRAVKSNLADKKNPEFNARIYLGAVPIPALSTMTSTEMASDAKKRERQKTKKDALEACQSDWDLRNVKRARGQFPCGKCKSDNTTYFQMQTRSSDEPMTTYVNCLHCGNRWKF